MMHIVVVGRQDMTCRFCKRRRKFVITWTGPRGTQTRACLRHTLEAWRDLDRQKAGSRPAEGGTGLFRVSVQRVDGEHTSGKERVLCVRAGNWISALTAAARKPGKFEWKVRQ
jgi:predicted Fe-S protein YdhL (DUF1289 family)